MKLNFYKVLVITLMAAFFAPIALRAMNDDNKENNNNHKKRNIKEVGEDFDVLNDKANNSKKRICVFKLSSDDWEEVYTLLANGNTEEFTQLYLGRIYDSNQMDVLVVHALDKNYREVVVDALNEYDIPLLKAILANEEHSVKDLLYKHKEKVTACHVHCAMILGYRTIMELLLKHLSKEQLQTYTYEGLNFIEYALNNDPEESHLDLLVQYGCPVGYREMKELIDAEQGDYFDLFLQNIQDINEKPTPESKSLLWHCIRYQMIQAVPDLLNKGATVEQQDIIENYCSGMRGYDKNVLFSLIKDKRDIPLNTIVFSDSTSRIASNLGKNVEPSLLQECLNQAVKNRLLIDFFEEGNKKKSEVLLLCGADPNVWYEVEYNDNTSEYMPLLIDMAVEDRDARVFLLLRYGANPELLLLGEGLDSYSDSIKNIALLSLSMKLLEKFPCNIDTKSYEKNEKRLNLCLKYDKDLKKLFNKNVSMNNIGPSNPQSRPVWSKQQFLSMLGSKQVFGDIAQNYGLKNMYTYLATRHPHVAKRLLMHTIMPNPYVAMNSKEKNKCERWMKRYKENSIPSGHDALHDRTRDNRFADLRFEFC